MIKVCSVDGCGRGGKVIKGFCNRHYQRFLKYGDPLLGHDHAASGASRAWLDANLNHAGPECLIFPFGRSGCGRGELTIDSKNIHADVYMCRIAHGEKPSPKHEAAHSCGKGHEGCVAPTHLRWATRKENAADRIIHGTALLGERHHQAKLDEVSARFIKIKCEMIKTRGVRAQLARDFGVYDTVISSIANGRTWRHVEI
jgi:hypothetical protein